MNKPLSNRLIKLLVNALFLLSIVTLHAAVAGDKIDQALNVEASGIVFINIPRGVVEIQGWNKAQILLQGELDDAVEKVIFKNSRQKTLVQVITHVNKHWGDGSALKVFVPQGSQVRFKGVDTSFRLSDLKAGVAGNTINGDLSLNNISDKIVISSVSGNIKVFDSEGIIQIESVSGLVDFAGDYTRARIKVMSGDITADITGSSRLTTNNISGDTTIIGNVKHNAKVEIRSVSGDIIFNASQDLDAKCEMSSQFGGEITNNLTDDLPNKSKLHHNQLSFVSGKGAGHLTVNTVSGAITIENRVINTLAK